MSEETYLAWCRRYHQDPEDTGSAIDYEDWYEVEHHPDIPQLRNVGLGVVVYWDADRSVPDGYARCDGGLLDLAHYPDLDRTLGLDNMWRKPGNKMMVPDLRQGGRSHYVMYTGVPIWPFTSEEEKRAENWTDQP